MTTATAHFQPGNLVRARGREWVVQADSSFDEATSLLRLRPLGGADEDTITLIPELEFEPVTPATFAWPQPEQAGNHAAALLLPVDHFLDDGSSVGVVATLLSLPLWWFSRS